MATIKHNTILIGVIIPISKIIISNTIEIERFDALDNYDKDKLSTFMEAFTKKKELV